MISHERKFVFIHIPKTGGTSVSKKLGLFSERSRGAQDHRPLIDIEPFSLAHLQPRNWGGDNLYRYARRQLGHLRKGRRRLSREEYDRYYKFAFVRNSWARAVSWYKNVMRDELTRRQAHISEDCSFKRFLTDRENLWHLKSQLFWLTDSKGQVAMDFVGRFERLQDDFNHVCGTIGIEDTQLPMELVSGGKHYTSFYDDEAKETVARIYAKEIAEFGFEFGD